MIKLLDKSVYELIAAGEVIERPSSVIKELVENAVDAGARRITVEIKNGGITYMRVTDDGCGISFEEIPTAFLRHATSKISTADQLESISTLGFRGEALASVAAVTRTEVLTKRLQDELGTAYKIEGGEETLHEKTGCPDGTTIIMRDLFFNTPARLKFLKKDATEGNYVQSVVDKLALSYPEISFSFIRDGKTVRVTSGDGKLYSSIYAVFGKQFAASLTEVDYEQNHIKVGGYITTPYACRANRQMQYFFINGRWVRNTTCMAALEEGYKNSVMVGKFPACVLKIQLPPSLVDVNVSPSKTEVRFAEERAIFETIYLAVKNGILNADNKKNVNNSNNDSQDKYQSDDKFSANIADDKDDKHKTESADLCGLYHLSAVKEPSSEEFSHNDSLTSKKNVHNINNDEKAEDDKPIAHDYSYSQSAANNQSSEDRIYARLSSSKTVYKPLPPKNIFVQQIIEDDCEETKTEEYQFINQNSFIRAGSEEEKNFQTPDPIVEERYKPQLKYIGELFKTYILCECGEELVLIDKHAAHERIRFEQLKKDLKCSSQFLADNIVISMSLEEITALSDNIDYLESLGIDLNFKSDREVEIIGFPAIITNRLPQDAVQKIAEILINGGDDIEGELYDGILHTVACKGAIKANENTSDKELAQLAKAVWENAKIRYCPHGRPIIITMSKNNIERNFGRIQ